MSKNAKALAAKAEGNTFFKNKQYSQAIDKYTEAINHDNSDVTFFSNRSACYAALNEWEKAAEDGKSCIVTNRSFVKGYFRAGLALQKLQNYEAAQDVVKRGLGVDSANADLKRMNRELEEAMRQRRVEQAIEQGRKQLRAKEVNDAYKTVDSGLRLDPNNSTLNKLMDEIKPLYERAEKQRVSGLDRTERMKEEGDNHFKSAAFEAAIKSYSDCIAALRDDSCELALKCYANRAACYKQISNFDGTIGDSTMVLEYKPNDIKSLMRRAQASEASERYKSALQDVRQVLALGVDAVGKTTYDLANGMQHRLNRVIADLRKHS
jgi:stress-induced-phosphoprotein 1